MRFDGLISVERHHGVLHATLCSPPENALGVALLEQIAELVRTFERGSAKVLLLSSGVAGVFAAGADLREAPEPGARALGAQELADYHDSLSDALERLARCRRPTIAVIDGFATGAGLELAMACTMRFASSAARLALPEVRVGMVPSGGATQRLPQLVGRGRALDLMLSGREIGAQDAERIGLVDRLLLGEALAGSLEIATSLASYSAPAMEAIICCVDAAHDLPHEDGLAVERAAVASALEEGEARERITALVDRPTFGARAV
jgi:enoyl-CoA hydratase